MSLFHSGSFVCVFSVVYTQFIALLNVRMILVDFPFNHFSELVLTVFYRLFVVVVVSTPSRA